MPKKDKTAHDFKQELSESQYHTSSGQVMHNGLSNKMSTIIHGSTSIQCKAGWLRGNKYSFFFSVDRRTHTCL